MSYISDELSQIAEKCGFEIEKKWNGYNSYIPYKIHGTPGDIKKPNSDLYFEIFGLPSRKGSIGKLVALEYYRWDLKYHLYFEENKKVIKFDTYNCRYLKDYNGPTKYFFLKREKKVISELTNKFGQKLYKGNLVVGFAGSGNDAYIVLGYIERWTKSSVFVKPYGHFGKITNEKRGDILLKNYKQTIVLPSDENWQEVLKKELFVTLLTTDC